MFLADIESLNASQKRYSLIVWLCRWLCVQEGLDVHFPALWLDHFLRGNGCSKKTSFARSHTYTHTCTTFQFLHSAGGVAWPNRPTWPAQGCLPWPKYCLLLHSKFPSSSELSATKSNFSYYIQQKIKITCTTKIENFFFKAAKDKPQIKEKKTDFAGCMLLLL